jgi:putative phage-type endonuclease
MRSFKMLDLVQGSEQWKKYKWLKIGSSEAADIMGVGFNTPLQLFEKKINQTETPDNEDMKRGRDQESTARDYFNKHHGTFHVPVCIQSIEHEFAMASLDGYDETAAFPIIEIKCPRKGCHEFIPEYYIPQLQHQMMVSGAPDVVYFSWHDGVGKPIWVKRDQEYINILIEKEKEFYERFLRFDPPPFSDKDFVQLDDPDALIFSRAYKQVDGKVKELEKEKELLRKKILEKVSHSRSRIGEIKVYSQRVKGRVDYEAIPELKAVDLEKYRKPSSECWKILT